MRTTTRKFTLTRDRSTLVNGWEEELTIEYCYTPKADGRDECQEDE